MSSLFPPSQAAAAGGSPLARRWAEFSPRERVLVGVMAAALAVLVVWLLAVRPAWRTLAQAPALRAQADQQLLQMQALIAEAKQLRGLPGVPTAQAAEVLKGAAQRLGTRAKLQVQAERATLTLAQVSGEEIRQFLLEARTGARARPVELQLTRADDLYSGTVVLALPGTQ